LEEICYPHFLHLQVGPRISPWDTLKLETAISSETSVNNYNLRSLISHNILLSIIKVVNIETEEFCSYFIPIYNEVKVKVKQSHYRS
jgi:hypothetical protein